MSRLALINKTLKRQQTHDKYHDQIKRLKSIFHTSKEILQIRDEKLQEKRVNMLKGSIKHCKVLSERYTKALLNNDIKSYSFIIMLIFQKFPRNAFANRIRKRCIFTGRPRGLQNQMSGMFIRRFARDFLLYGYTKI